MEEIEGEKQNRSSDNIKNFLKSKRFLSIITLGAVVILFVAIGPVRKSAGDFLASALGIVQRTFTPSEVYIGEIPLNNSASPAKPKTAAGSNIRTDAPTAKTGSSAKTVPVNSRDKEITALNDEVNALQAQLSSVSSSVSLSASVPASASTSLNSSSAPAGGVSSTGRILISEIMVGADGNSNYEFIELYNAGSAPVDLTGWSVRKKSSTGNESSLVAASRLSGKVIQPGKYFLLGNENGYKESVAPDVAWPSSYTLAYTNNSVVLYGADGSKVEEIFWAEIPKGQSFVRTNWTGSQFTLTGSPTPQNSQGP